ncbi:Hypothetical_protein [Hexamita inflata]|uniref:Hypothetical_protein n=1 Tax=Hexamita inflata TaxID=28002 RepID=A0AA86QCN2_9EUKA|nr:Hypothetical protein HINF_LOCUS38317 [Hexamita inflata]
MLAEAMEEILESDLPTKDLLDVMLLSKDDGESLDLITPGAYFDLMIQNRDMEFQDPTKVNKETRYFFSKNRHEFINSKQYPNNVKSEVKLGHCLDNYNQITNKGFQYYNKYTVIPFIKSEAAIMVNAYSKVSSYYFSIP